MIASAVAVTGFIFSILAVVVSAATGFFTYRQASAAFEQAKAAMDAVEIARREFLEELRPTLIGEIEHVKPPGHRLNLRSASPLPLAELEARIVAGYGVKFVSAASGGEPDRATVDRLDAGSTTHWWVLVDDHHSDGISLTVSCRGNEPGQKWENILVNVPVFPELNERTPVLFGEIVKLEGRRRLQLQLQSQGSLKKIEATITGGYGVRFAEKAIWGELSRGGIAGWDIVKDKHHSDIIHLEVVCAGMSEERWVVPLSMPTWTW